jgi:hypothetical protein
MLVPQKETPEDLRSQAVEFLPSGSQPSRVGMMVMILGLPAPRMVAGLPSGSAHVLRGTIRLCPIPPL